MALMPVADARLRILAGVEALKPEAIPLEYALGRVLARDVIAKRDQPPFAASAMDGYALRHADLASIPARLRVVDTSGAGHASKRAVTPGTSIRIFTGAPLPRGADTVVIQENTTREGDNVVVHETCAAGRNVRRAALDFAKGDMLMAKGSRLRPRDIGLLAAGNAAKVSVHRAPRVVVLATGDELVLPGQRAKADQIYSSNSHALHCLAQSQGAVVTNLGIVPDNLRATIAAIRKAENADILVTTGGASVGDHDHVQEALKAAGVKIDFWKIAMRPGKPFMYGRKGKLHVMGLPGNPVSALVTARLFLKPLLDAMAGLPTDDLETTAILTSTLPANDQRQDYLRATLRIGPDGTRHATPFSAQDSSMQRTMQLAQALIVRPPNAPEASAGAAVPILILDF